ncbi:MAG: prenyltransferase/squalene oxidase repeat-containing protein [Dongiaceae bacterium]
MTAALTDAIRRGVAGLVGRQKPDGSFPLVTGSPARGWRPCGRLFSTAYVMMIAGDLLPAQNATRALAFIRAQRRPDRLWEYDPAIGIPPDSDSTACALNALSREGRAEDLADGAALLRSFWRPEAGPFRSWPALGMWSLPERDDPVVNGNILASLRRLGAAPTAAEEAAALALCARTRPRYYCGPAVVAHAAHLGGLPLAALPAAVTARPDPEDLLACVQWLAATGEDDAELVAAVLAAQRPDGAWPIRCWVRAQGVPVPFWGSAAVTTAIALEALSRLARG